MPQSSSATEEEYESAASRARKFQNLRRTKLTRRSETYQIGPRLLQGIESGRFVWRPVGFSALPFPVLDQFSIGRRLRNAVRCACTTTNTYFVQTRSELRSSSYSGALMRLRCILIQFLLRGVKHSRSRGSILLDNHLCEDS